MRNVLLIVVLAVFVASLSAAGSSIQQPKVVQAFQPVYPFELFQQRVAGRAVVEFVVDTDGQPVEIKAVESSHKQFEQSAIVCISKWRFSPGIKDGHPVRTKLRVPFDFTPPQRESVPAGKSK